MAAKNPLLNIGLPVNFYVPHVYNFMRKELLDSEENQWYLRDEIFGRYDTGVSSLPDFQVTRRCSSQKFWTAFSCLIGGRNNTHILVRQAWDPDSRRLRSYHMILSRKMLVESLDRGFRLYHELGNKIPLKGRPGLLSPTLVEE